jgi:hypothetical protein
MSEIIERIVKKLFLGVKIQIYFKPSSEIVQVLNNLNLIYRSHDLQPSFQFITTNKEIVHEAENEWQMRLIKLTHITQLMIINWIFFDEKMSDYFNIQQIYTPLE